MSEINIVELSESMRNSKYTNDIKKEIEKAYNRIMSDFNINNKTPQDIRYAINSIIRYEIQNDVEIVLLRKAAEVQINKQIKTSK